MFSFLLLEPFLSLYYICELNLTLPGEEQQVLNITHLKENLEEFKKEDAEAFAAFYLNEYQPSM